MPTSTQARANLQAQLDAVEREIGEMIPTNAPNGSRPWLSRCEAAEYLHSLGFSSVTENTIHYHAYETGKLPRPKKVAGQSYWKRADLDKLVEAL